MNDNNGQRLETAATTILITAFAIISVGAAATPAVMAICLNWAWIFTYPVLFAALVVWTNTHKKRKK